MSFGNIAVSSILIGIFMIAIFSIGVELATENDLNSSILDRESIYNASFKVQEELEDVVVIAEDQRKSFEEDIPILGDIGLILKSIAGVTRVFYTTVRNFFNLTGDLIKNTIGVPTLFLNGMVAIILLLLTIGAWRVYRSGT